jgi:hypothetical protein
MHPEQGKAQPHKKKVDAKVDARCPKQTKRFSGEGSIVIARKRKIRASLGVN